MNFGPDLFQFYIRSISDLLAGDDFVPASVDNSRLVGAGNGSFKDKDRASSSSLFSNAIGNKLSSHEKALLTSKLRQCVIALSQEADEMLDPVMSMIRLRALMEPTPTKSCVGYQDINGNNGTEIRAQKRLKVSVDDEPLNISPHSCNLSGEGSLKEQKGVAEGSKSLTRCINKGCLKSMQKSNSDDSKSLCDDCSKQGINKTFPESSSREDIGNGEVNDDLQFLLGNKPIVLEKMEKHSAELSATLQHMKDKLEDLLDIVISSCRPMTITEMHKLRSLVGKLPPKNLDRVVEIVKQGKPPEYYSTNEIVTELQNEDNVTLWRIYIYVKAVENAAKLS
ncbi:uncharacterized protein [Rutidosis leptorrhynchoides]|uniref:uncharacterized protein n=1 Tax=Rutidosis leptorrhynchoides TaxID=125765 RepID=UPI003A9A11E5